MVSFTVSEPAMAWHSEMEMRGGNLPAPERRAFRGKGEPEHAASNADESQNSTYAQTHSDNWASECLFDWYNS